MWIKCETEWLNFHHVKTLYTVENMVWAGFPCGMEKIIFFFPTKEEAEDKLKEIILRLKHSDFYR